MHGSINASIISFPMASASDPPEQSLSNNTSSFQFPANASLTPEKFNGKNYLSWEGYVNLWFKSQGLHDHLTMKPNEIPENERNQWMRIDNQLVPLLWQSIDPNLLVHFRSLRTCFDVWNQVRSFYSTNLRRFYDVVVELLTLRMRDRDLLGYLNKALGVVQEVRFFLGGKALQEVPEKFDTFLMCFVLQGLSKDFDAVRNQILLDSQVTTTEGLYNRLMPFLLFKKY